MLFSSLLPLVYDVNVFNVNMNLDLYLWDALHPESLDLVCDTTTEEKPGLNQKSETKGCLLPWLEMNKYSKIKV